MGGAGRRAVALGAIVLVCGCARIIEGDRQDIEVMTEPAGAQCNVERDGFVIAVVKETPGKVTLDRTKSPITIQCDKAGYRPASLVDRSDGSAATAANILAITMAPVALGIDAASGALNKYTSPVSLTLIKATE